MMTTKKSKTAFKTPDLSISKVNQEKAAQLFGNFLNGTKVRLEKNAKSFSTFAVMTRMVKKSSEDPSMEFILEVIKRLEKDKVNSEIALQIAETAQSHAQNLQKIVLLRMIPFFVGLLGMIVMTSLALGVKPLAIDNPALLKFLIPLVLFIPLFIWGLGKRNAAKFDLLAANVLMQGASAYASAKMQGKGQIGALQNLEEMRRRAKTMDSKESAKKKEEKKTKTKNKK